MYLKNLTPSHVFMYQFTDYQFISHFCFRAKKIFFESVYSNHIFIYFQTYIPLKCFPHVHKHDLYFLHVILSSIHALQSLIFFQTTFVSKVKHAGTVKLKPIYSHTILTRRQRTIQASVIFNTFIFNSF